jgi:hypothetical protein
LTNVAAVIVVKQTLDFLKWSRYHVENKKELVGSSAALMPVV